MKKIYHLIILLYLSITQAQTDTFPYQLEYWKPMGMSVQQAFPVDNGGYLLIGRVTNYSPEVYPGLFSDEATQQQWQGKNGLIIIKTDGDFNVLAMHPIISNLTYSGNFASQASFFKNDEQELFFYYHHQFGKLNADGSVAYIQTLDEDIKIVTMTFHNGVLYGLRAHEYINATTTIPGSIYRFDADTGGFLGNDSIGDPSALVVDYLGIAVDDSGIYVMGSVLYSEMQTGLPIDYDFYYTEGAFQPFQAIIVNPLFSSYIGFLTKYELENPAQMQWSTYLAGEGHYFPHNQNVPRNFLKLIGSDLYLTYTASNTTNISTSGSYMENVALGLASFIMRFSATGERLMGTYLLNVDGFTYHVLSEGSSQENGIVIKMGYNSDSTNSPISLSVNAPYSQLGTSNTLVQEFSPNGERVYGIIVSNNGDVSRNVSVIAEQEGLKIFAEASEIANLSPYLTTEESVINLMANSAFSVASYNKRGPVSTEDAELLSFSLYPNPVSETLFVTSESQELIHSYRIIDVSGKVIRSQPNISSSELQIPVSGLSSGLYFLELETARETQRLKFIKK